MSKPTAPAHRSEPAGNAPNRMPADSSFYNRVVPLLLAGMGLLMLVLILIAAGIALGWIKF